MSVSEFAENLNTFTYKENLFSFCFELILKLTSLMQHRLNANFTGSTQRRETSPLFFVKSF